MFDPFFIRVTCDMRNLNKDQQAVILGLFKQTKVMRSKDIVILLRLSEPATIPEGSVLQVIL